MIWLAIFDLISLAELGNIFKLFKKHTRLILAACLFAFWCVLSCFWSPNPLRGILTAGLILAIFYAILSIFAEIPNKKFLVREAKIFIGTSFTISIFCILQGFLDVFDLQNNLLCVGCHYQVLGFPHSNGFAIEPQFMGNLLIAPSILSLDILYKKIKSKKGKSWFGFSAITFVQLLALFICFSRGAIYSFGIAILIIALRDIYHKRYMRSVIYITTSIIACLGGLLTQGIWAQLSPTSEGFFEGISRSIDQLTLGKIKPATNNNEVQVDEVIILTPDGETNDSQFTGYIEESTDIRLTLNADAIETWSQSPKTMLTGVGLGGAGRAIAEFKQDRGEREIVQNEFISLLLEIGIIGHALILWLLFQLIHNRNKRTSIVFWAIVFAYLISMNFYSGITNVWHIYLFTPVLYLLPGIRRSKAHMLK